MIRFSALLLVIAAAMMAASSDAEHDKPILVSGCHLLSEPSAFNGKLVEVHGMINSDFEHFDMRFSCKGYLQLQTSTRESDGRKFGFITAEDEQYKKLIAALPKSLDMVGKNCLECRRNDKRIYASVVALFRCHEDFATCSGTSRFGDGALVVKRVLSVRVSAVPTKSKQR